MQYSISGDGTEVELTCKTDTKSISITASIRTMRSILADTESKYTGEESDAGVPYVHREVVGIPQEDRHPEAIYEFTQGGNSYVAVQEEPITDENESNPRRECLGCALFDMDCFDMRVPDCAKRYRPDGNGIIWKKL
jgi:hypothetical protein